LKKSIRCTWIAAVMLTLVAIVAVLAVVTGCSPSTLAPLTFSNSEKLNWLDMNFGDELAQRGSGIDINKCPILYDTTLSEVVSPYGSQIDMVHGMEKIGFSLPYMAVKTSITLTIRVTKYQAPFGEFWLLDCGPDGTVFDQPLYVQPNSAVTSNSSSVLFYYNPTNKKWEVEETASQPSPQMPIYHFSKYGISD
jgi:hypothetical protein